MGFEVAGVPQDEVVMPEALLPLFQGRTPRLVWRNELGGLTWEAPGEFFVKWAPVDSGLQLDVEAHRLRWAAAFTPVPRVIGQGQDEQGSWLQTVALHGKSAVDEVWKADPVTAVRAIGEGLRAMHDALPVDECPFDWSASTRLAQAILPTAGLEQPPPVDLLVVCHGDACAPNTLIGDDGRWSGHVDLGALGLGDRWADLAVATWSTEWNYGPGYEQVLLDAYGIQADAERTAYYRRLWDVGP
jgi:kanamycin kinase